MIKSLRKNKLKSFLSEKQNDFLIFQSLPLKVKNFIDLKNKLHLNHIKVKYLKSNEARGIFRQISHENYENLYSKLFSASLIMLQGKDETVNFLENYTKFSKENDKIFEENQLYLIAASKEGRFYHGSTLENALKEKVSVNKLAQNFVKPKFQLINTFQQNNQKLCLLLTCYLKEQESKTN